MSAPSPTPVPRKLPPQSLTPVRGGVLAVPGFRGASARCGLYEDARDDLALIVCDRECVAAGVFTRNAVPAAPIVVTRERVRSTSRARSIVINAGNANALTGTEGMLSAERMASRVDQLCGAPGLVLSTGVIGVPLPIDAVLTGMDLAASRLSNEPKTDEAVARAILTTDTRPKSTALQLTLPGDDRPTTIGGVAKGSGMIHPNMATMLAVLALDRAVEPAVLDRLLRTAVDRSFNQISVDGDTSTNDAVLILARPEPGESPVGSDPAALRALEDAIGHVCGTLAEEIVADGEGATKVLRVEVSGARNDEEATRIAGAVARSLLVKTAVAGRDPNWGRIIAVAGNAGVQIDPSRVDLTLGGVPVFLQGSPRALTREDERTIFLEDVIVAHLDLGEGEGRARMLTTDLTHEYVRINSEYTT